MSRKPGRKIDFNAQELEAVFFALVSVKRRGRETALATSAFFAALRKVDFAYRASRRKIRELRSSAVDRGRAKNGKGRKAD